MGGQVKKQNTSGYIPDSVVSQSTLGVEKDKVIYHSRRAYGPVRERGVDRVYGYLGTLPLVYTLG